MSLALYKVALDPAADEVERLTTLLSEEERQRATRFHFDRDRRRFVVRRAKLREILSVRTGVPPELLRFEAGPHGKPRLHGDICHFSASHSNERMLVAIDDRELGCDIERIVPDFDWPPLAERFFARDEQRALLAAPDGLRAFFRCWTRKEAFVKGLGLGLSYPLDGFEVTVGEAAEILSGGDGWSLASGAIGDGYIFAVASRGRLPARIDPEGT